MNRYRPPKPLKTEVFFTDAARLEELIRIHRDLLSGEASIQPMLAETLDGAESILSVIASEDERRAQDPSHQGPAILHLELDKTQSEALRLARHLARKSTKSGVGAVALRG